MASGEEGNDGSELSFDSSDTNSSFEEELAEVFGEIDIGYRFEPRIDPAHAQESDESDESEDDLPLPPHNDRVGNTNWCSCGRCVNMPTDMESTCCREINTVTEKEENEDLELRCICEHPEFIMCCLNSAILRISAVTVSSMLRTNVPDPLNDRFFRLTAYRQFAIWIHNKLGRHNRRVVPSCVVKEIRQQYPALVDQEEYIGFALADN